MSVRIAVPLVVVVMIHIAAHGEREAATTGPDASFEPVADRVVIGSGKEEP